MPVPESLRRATMIADTMLTAFREYFDHGERMRLTLVVRFDGAPDDAALVFGDDEDVEAITRIIKRMVKPEHEVIRGSRLPPRETN